MGEHPLIFTEIGIPYDMDDDYAYKTGDYSSQISAMDANHFALEGSQSNGFTLWLYMSQVRSLLLPLLNVIRQQFSQIPRDRTTTNGEINGTGKTYQYFLTMTTNCQMPNF